MQCVESVVFFMVSPALDSCLCSSHIPQLYPPCSSSTLLPFLTCLVSFIHSLFLIIKIQQPSTISVPFMCIAVQLCCVCCVYCVFCSLISFFFSCWHKPLHLPVCVFADILFINGSAERSTSGAAVSLQKYCRRSWFKSVPLQATWNRKGWEIYIC